MDKANNQYRKSIRLMYYDYASAGYYFVTIVSNKRKCIFGEIENGNLKLNPAGLIVENSWEKIPLHYPNVNVDTFIVIPNHFHGIIIINDVGARHASPLHKHLTSKTNTLGHIIGSFKSAVTKQIHDLGINNQEKIWQRNYYEHIIHDERDYNEIYEYIQFNPINWSLDEENPERFR